MNPLKEMRDSMTQQNRKDEHVHLFRELYHVSDNDFDGVRFVHHSIPETKVDDVDLSTKIGPIKLKYPIFINAMTGGSKHTMKINEQLAIVCRETNLAMATGSMSVALKYPEARKSFEVIRKVNPNGIVFANIGANHGLEDAKRIIHYVEADALQIHINAPQELVMPEGDCDFTSWLYNIETIVRGVNVPVIVKEVGFGMSRETVRLLSSIGVKIIDVSGRGGTNFIRIENERRSDNGFYYLSNWGQSTVISLLEANIMDNNPLEMIASGGIRHMLDVVKALALGAKAVGIAGRYLHYLLEQGIDALINLVENDINELGILYALLGSSNWQGLQYTDLIFNNEIISWCESRLINVKQFARRSQRLY